MNKFLATVPHGAGWIVSAKFAPGKRQSDDERTFVQVQVPTKIGKPMPEYTAQPFQVTEGTLPRGLHYRFATSLYAQRSLLERVLPWGNSVARTFPVPSQTFKAPYPPPPQEDRPARLATIIMTWSLYQYCDPDHQEAKDNLGVAFREALKEGAMAPVDKYTAVLRHLASALNDGHAMIGRRVPLAGANLAGYPRLAFTWVGSKLYIARVDTSLRGKVHPGDRVVSIDGVSVEAGYKEAAGLISSPTERFKRHAAITPSTGRAFLVLGSLGANMHLELERDGVLLAVDAPRDQERKDAFIGTQEAGRAESGGVKECSAPHFLDRSLS